MPLSIGANRARRVRVGLAVTALATTLAYAPLAAAQPLDLATALARAAAHDLTRPASEARVQAAEAGARQAAVGPRPSVGLDVETFGGTGERTWLDQTETTLYYQQTLERGGKREARTGAARAEIAVARLQGQVRALDALAVTQTLWVDAAAAEAGIALAEERLALAERLARETRRRVDAARDPLFAAERARTAVVQARIARDQARDTANTARAALADRIGGATDIEIDLNAFERAAPALGLLPSSPQTADVRLLEARRDAAQARMRVEESQVTQDPTLRAGVRHFRDGGDVAFVVGGSIPLGRADSYRGDIDRARAERLAAEADIAAAVADRDREIARLLARRAASETEVGRIDVEVLPVALRAVDLVRDGYKRGGGAFTYTEVAEAQRVVIEARARRIELLRSIHMDAARLDRLTTRHALLIANAETR